MTPNFVWIFLFLSICVSTDVLYAKVYNKFIIASLIISLSLLFIYPPMAFYSPILSFFIAFVLGILLFKFKVLGGGDVKAMLVTSLFLTPEATMWFFAYSVIWGGVFSIFYFATQGSLQFLIHSTVGTFKKFTFAVHKIPFTIGILLGFLSIHFLGFV